MFIQLLQASVSWVLKSPPVMTLFPFSQRRGSSTSSCLLSFWTLPLPFMTGVIIVLLSFYQNLHKICRDFLSNIGTILTFAFVGTLFNTFRWQKNIRYKIRENKTTLFSSVGLSLYGIDKMIGPFEVNEIKQDKVFSAPPELLRSLIRLWSKNALRTRRQLNFCPGGCCESHVNKDWILDHGCS